MVKKLTFSLSAWLLLVYALAQVAFFYPRWEKTGTEATLSWDVFGYYLYLPAIFIYDDPHELKFKEEIMAKYQPAGDFHHAYQNEDGSWVMKYAIGQSLVFAPGFFIAHALAEPLGYAADGFSAPYQAAISLTALLIAFLGLFVLRKVLLQFYSEVVTAATLAVIVLATNYLNYSAVDGAMPHNTLFTLYAIILWLTLRWHEAPRRVTALWLGLAIGFATIIRPTDIMVAAIPGLWGVAGIPSFRQKIMLLWQRRVDVILLGVGMFVMGMVQLSYWKYAAGSWIHYSYGEFGFYWSKPEVWLGLFGWRKGWFVYTPVMILAVVGFVPLFRYVRESFWAILLLMIVTIYVVFAWEIWWYGGSFGARPLVQTYALMAMPLAAFFTWIANRKLLSGLVLLLTLGCTYLNMVMTYQAHAPNGGWEAEFMTHAYYWKIFGDPHPDKADKKFLDVRHDIGNDADYRKELLYHNDFETDTLAHRSKEQVFAGDYAMLLNDSVQFSPAFQMPINDFLDRDDAWIRSSAMAYFPYMEWNRWQMTQMVMQFLRDGQMYRETTARIQYAMEPGQWGKYFFEMPINSKARPGDEVKVYFWQAGGQTPIFIDDWQVEVVWKE